MWRASAWGARTTRWTRSTTVTPRQQSRLLESGANALETIAAVKATLARLQSTYPSGLEVVYPIDTSPFVEHSLHDVLETLLEAIALVFLVMLVFLQSVRATLIPTIAVPVVLLGTTAVLAAFGYPQAELANRVTLYKALGGGWQDRTIARR